MTTFRQIRIFATTADKIRRGVAFHAVLPMLIFTSAIMAAERTVVDDLGFKVKVKSNIDRVVSLVPTNSEMVCLLDCARLKGGTRYDQFPEELKERVQRKQIEIIGGGFDANLEKIVQLQPDLILTNGPTQQRFAVPLKNLGYSVLSLWPRDLEGLKRDLALLGELLEQEERAKQIIDRMQQRFAAVTTKVNHRHKKRVYLQMWTEPLITVGKSSFPDWLVGAAGGVNVFGDLPFDSGQVSVESIIRRRPDVLIFLAEQKRFAHRIKADPLWMTIEAVRNSRFCFIEESDIGRSVQFLDGLEKLYRCLNQWPGAAGPRRSSLES